MGVYRGQYLKHTDKRLPNIQNKTTEKLSHSQHLFFSPPSQSQFSKTGPLANQKIILCSSIMALESRWIQLYVTKM